jgi:pantoate--beta-alanine ligase
VREHRSDDPPGLLTTLAELRASIRDAKVNKRRVGLVPTMGALHAGHLSLVEKSNHECDFTVVTIFVNPTQFGAGEDYDRYPRNLQKDRDLLAPLGVDVVFAPSRDEMYRPGHATFVNVDRVADLWEGAIRPGHFRGVATIVLKLFNAAEPDVAYFGQKDYQQSVIIRRMTADLDLPIEIRVCPIVRDPDCLALSSRNVYLSPDDRKRALSLSQSLRAAEELVSKGMRDARQIEASMRNILSAADVQIDHAVLVDPGTLAKVDHVEPGTVALVAARVGATRLIDNTFLG